MSRPSWAPIDSADARELRERELAQEASDAGSDVEHAATCRDGWLGEDDQGQPIPCTRCRPHLARGTCRTCNASSAACTTKRRGRCCDRCHHPERNRP